MLVSFKFVSVTSNENIDPQLPLKRCKGFSVPPRNDLMTMGKADLELPNCYNFLFGIRARNLK